MIHRSEMFSYTVYYHFRHEIRLYNIHRKTADHRPNRKIFTIKRGYQNDIICIF